MCATHAFAADNTCATTGGPPVPNSYFIHGSPGLSANIHTLWRLGTVDGNKLPYFSQYYRWNTEKEPHMTVEARRLDGDSPIVHAIRVNGATLNREYREPPEGPSVSFMTASLQIPAAGCWEITARYTPPSGKVETHSYTVLVME